MPPLDREEPYRPGAQLLHWLSALALIAMFAIAWYMTGLPKGPERGGWYGIHKSLGLSLALIIWIRLYWRLRGPLPAWPAAWPRRTVSVARWGHRAIYLLLLVIPLAGFLTSAYTANPIRFWGLELPRVLPVDEAMNAFWKLVHKAANYALLVILAGHVVAGSRLLLQGSRRMFSLRAPTATGAPTRRPPGVASGCAETAQMRPGATS